MRVSTVPEAWWGCSSVGRLQARRPEARASQHCWQVSSWQLAVGMRPQERNRARDWRYGRSPFQFEIHIDDLQLVILYHNKTIIGSQHFPMSPAVCVIRVCVVFCVLLSVWFPLVLLLHSCLGAGRTLSGGWLGWATILQGCFKADWLLFCLCCCCSICCCSANFSRALTEPQTLRRSGCVRAEREKAAAVECMGRRWFVLVADCVNCCSSTAFVAC